MTSCAEQSVMMGFSTTPTGTGRGEVMTGLDSNRSYFHPNWRYYSNESLGDDVLHARSNIRVAR
jgi:hypothetical protein